MTEGEGGQGPREEEDREIRRLKEHLTEMSMLANGMVADGTRALLTADPELRRSVVSRNVALDRYDLEIETQAIRLVATMQPEGPDLRTIEALIKIGTCVDRIGRLGYDLARYLSSSPLPGEDTQQTLRQMDARARDMLDHAIHSFIVRDAAEAKAVLHSDDEVDQLCRELQRRLIELLHQGGPQTDRLAYQLLASRHLERVADNACKIAEKAIYAITGERRSEYSPAPRQRETPGP
jgi:phosphate transport system protein